MNQDPELDQGLQLDRGPQLDSLALFDVANEALVLTVLMEMNKDHY